MNPETADFTPSITHAEPTPLELALQAAGVSSSHKPVFVVFFRSDCPWSAAELPKLAEAFQRNEGLPFTVVGIGAGQDTLESARQFAHERGWYFPVGADAESQLRNAFQVQRVPAIVVHDATGQVVRIYEGVTEQLVGIVEQTIMALLDGNEPPEYDMVGNGCAPS